MKYKIGHGTIIKRSKKKLHHNISYVYELNNDRALRFLAEIKDLLIIKKPHAMLLLKQYKKVTSRNGKYTKEQMLQKMKLVKAIRRLNKR